MILLRRTLVALAVALVVVVAGVAVSIPFDGWLNRGRVAALTNVVADGATPVAVYLARPAEADGPLPVVVMIHEFWGLNEALLSKADLLAADGCLVVAPDTLRGTTTRW
ncbi:MAG: dienelactone hydrolase family protein [Trueperaceae bacterium]|nr:dienelactone hydrolase family protein [Trueperaceae bacterium]